MDGKLGVQAKVCQMRLQGTKEPGRHDSTWQASHDAEAAVHDTALPVAHRREPPVIFPCSRKQFCAVDPLLGMTDSLASGRRNNQSKQAAVHNRRHIWCGRCQGLETQAYRQNLSTTLNTLTLIKKKRFC